MDGGGRIITRDSNGRFVPGISGNPASKRPGTRNRKTLLTALLKEGDAEAIGRVIIDKALGGDAVAARFCLERLDPKPRGPPIQLDLPEGESAAGDVVALFNSALRALAAGEITPAEAVEVSRFLEGRWRVLRAWQLEEKLTRWRDCLPVPGDRFVPDGVAERTADPLKRPTSSPLTPRSSPLPLRERVAQGWRGEAEPYPELGEEVPSADKMPERPVTACVSRAAPPHPAPAKLDDVSLSLRNPPELLSKGPPGERGSEWREEGTLSGAAAPLDLAGIPDEVATAVRDRILALPGVREIAQELALLPSASLHSTCISTPSPRLAAQPHHPPRGGCSQSRNALS